MSYNERTVNILGFLKENKSASVEQLAKLLYVSEATVRRDLAEMQKSGQIERSHGGAVYIDRTDELSIYARQIKNAREKERAAAVALKHLPEYSTVFIDNSSTCLALAKHMNFTHKTVITNGLQAALQIARQDGVTLIMPGGEIRHNTSAVMGSATACAIGELRFDLALTSCSALDENGSYEFSLDSMQIKRAALKNSRIRLLIFDSTKTGKTAGFRTAALTDYNALITDAPDQELTALSALPVKIFNK